MTSPASRSAGFDFGQAGGSFLTPRFLRYVVCSGLAAVTNFLVGNLLYNLAGWDGTWSYRLSVTLGCSAGMVVGYLLNRVFTFDRSGRRMHQEAATFVVISLGGLILTVLIAACLRAYVTPDRSLAAGRRHAWPVDGPRGNEPYPGHRFRHLLFLQLPPALHLQ